MANANVNKIIYGGETLIDLTADTVTPEQLKKGIKAHDKSGAIITGTCTHDVDSTDATAAQAEILLGKTAYARGAKVTGTMPNNGAQNGEISTKTGTATIKQGYHDGSGKVGISKTEQDKLIAENIRNGVTILGVSGSMTGTEDANPQTVTVTPTTSAQTILPDSTSGYNYLAQVTVSAIPYVETDNSAGGITVTIAG